MDIYNLDHLLFQRVLPLFVSLLILSSIAITANPRLLIAYGESAQINTAGTSFNAQIAAGNYVYVVWQDTTTGSGDIYFSSSADDFASFDNLSEENAGASTIPQITAIGDDIYVVWQDTTTGSGDIYFVKSTNGGGSFASGSALENTAGSSTVAQVAVQDNNVYVVWQDTTTGSGDIYFKASADNGDTFASLINLSDNAGASTVPQIATGGNNVYVVWQDTTTGSGDIYFKASADNGDTFGAVQTLSPAGSSSSTVPQIAAVGDNVYVVWQETVGNNEVYFAVSSDAGTGFSSVNLSSNSGSSTIPEVSAIDSFVYVVWRDNTDLASGNNDIFFKKSADAGLTFDTDAKNLSNRVLISDKPQVASSDSNVFVTWEDNFLGSSNFETLMAASTDNGDSFTSPINLSETNTNSRRPQIASIDDAAHAVWDDFVSGINTDVIVHSNIDYLEETISVDFVNDTSPKWGVDTVTASGSTVNADPDDEVTVEWGSSETPSVGIEIDEDGSWTATHEYGISAVGNNPHQIVAKIIDATSGDTEATSDPYDDEISVQDHDTVLVLENIASVMEGSGDEITVSGTLIDDDTGDGIDGQTITFGGTGTTLFPAGPIVTESDGTFVFTSAVLDEVSNDLDVQASFAGTPEFAPSDSNVVTYDIVDPSTIEFDVAAGDDLTIDLSNPIIPVDFGASITFDKLLTSGSIFVQECSPPSSTRYEALQDRCLEISLGAQTELGTFAHIQMEFTQDQVPEGYDIEDVELFHERGAELVDVTQSKDEDGLTVTGRTSEFSKFLLGAALHDDIPTGAIRLPLYVGQENTVTFRDVENKDESAFTITLDKDVYHIGDTAVLTIDDEDGNLDIGAIDAISAIVASETSYPDTITIQLVETGIGTGIFQGTFNLVNEDSSGNNLEVSTRGDGIAVHYDPWIPSGRLQAIIEGVEEAGFAQLSESVEDFDEEEDNAFLVLAPVATPVKIELVDAQLGDNSNVTITMTYANKILDIGQDDQLRIYYKDPILDWIDATIEDSFDADTQTLMGRADAPGTFTVGFPADTLGPGGAGGGLGKPGTGIVLDFIAAVARQSGGGGGGRSSTTDGGIGGGISTLPESNVINALVSGTTDVKIMLSFEGLTEMGDVAVETRDIFSLASTFSALDTSGGSTSIDGSGYRTSGSIYDIDTSAVKYNGSVTVTVPYNENILDGQSELDIRLIHYNGSQWEDVTTDINTINNTISGILFSTSPVATAIVTDGTFGKAYIDANSLSKIRIDEESIKLTDGNNEMSITATMKNLQRVTQQYTIIIQMIDENGIVQYIDFKQGSAERAQETEIAMKWMPPVAGAYSVKIFVWDSLERPLPLSAGTSTTFLPTSSNSFTTVQ